MDKSEEGKENNRTNILELIDNLILHINSERLWFNLIVFSSVFIAPVSLLFTIFLVLRGKFLSIIFRVSPLIGFMVIGYFLLNFIIASLWLIVGIKEYRFLSKWNERFKKYFSLKEQIDRELQKEFIE
ncbi:hypothetical protein [[Eubacterium] cellulosolvens]